MFKTIKAVNKGILFLTLQGTLNDNNFKEFDEDINYLLYKKGINYIVFNFDDLEITNKKILYKIQNKLIEICLTSGKVALCGLSKEERKRIDCKNDNLKFINSEIDAFNYMNI